MSCHHACSMPDGRFAPSPTGHLHLGNLRTALLAWLFARHDGGRFLVRVEDLDRAGCRPELERSQLDDLAELGLVPDGPVVRQSERFDVHRAALATLDHQGRTYPCFCTRREIAEATRAPHGTAGAYPGTCRDLSRAEQEQRAAARPPAVRLRAEGEQVTFRDRLHGTVSGEADDVVLRRNDGAPAYNLAVVVDDLAQGVAEVVRGDDLLPATPAQALVARLLGGEAPSYAHVPLVLGPDGRRLAKRDGAVTLADQRALGRTAGEVRSMLAASLGLAEDGEPVDLATLLKRFDPAAVPRTPWTLSP